MTVIVYVPDPTDVGVQSSVNVFELLHPVGSPLHEYVYEPEPPVAAVAVSTVCCPTSTGFTVAVGVPGAFNTGSTVNVNESCTEFPFESPYVTVIVYVPWVPELGVQPNEVVFVPLGSVHPVGTVPDQAYVYPPDPPVAAVVEIVVAWSTSTGFRVAEGVPCTSAGSTASAIKAHSWVELRVAPGV